MWTCSASVDYAEDPMSNCMTDTDPMCIEAVCDVMELTTL